MKLTVASSPHIRGSFRTNRIMLDVAIALLPALGVGVAHNGPRALWVVLVCVLASAGAEALYGLVRRTCCTVVDGSAAITGLLLGMTLPVSVPLWLCVVGSVFAVVFIKALCGGLGQNAFNPALSARALMLLVYPVGMTRFLTAGAVDAVAMATPLHHMVMPSLPEQSLLTMFIGNCPGAIGETSALALLIGFVYLLLRRVISARIPLAYLGTVALLTLLFPKAGSPVAWMAYSLFSGGVMLGAIFMATDYATSPVTPLGQIFYGVGCGGLTVLFRYFGLFPEGVTYAILCMNAVAWLLDRYTAPRRFGKKKGGVQA